MLKAHSIPVLASLLLTAVAGCGSDGGPTQNDVDLTASKRPETAAAKELKADLEQGAKDLIVMSETDSALTYVEAAIKASEAITPELILAKFDARHTELAGDDLGKLSERFVNPVDFNEFFEDQTEVADDEHVATRWTNLGKLMNEKLTDRVAVRFQSSDPKIHSDGGSITLFLVGRANGRVVGFFVELAET